VEPTTDQNKVVSLTMSLAAMGCIIIAAPVEHHDVIERVLRPLIDADLLGPVVILDGANGPCDHEKYLSAAADHLLGIRAAPAA
jgi:hypothetical protein